MKYTKIIPGYKTDHSAIIFTFATSLAKRGKEPSYKELVVKTNKQYMSPPTNNWR
jgi:hypothetical protein